MQPMSHAIGENNIKYVIKYLSSAPVAIKTFKSWTH